MARTETVRGACLARGFGTHGDIRWPTFRAGDLFELKYGKALIESNRRPGHIPVFGTNGQCGWHDAALFEGPGVVLGQRNDQYHGGRPSIPEKHVLAVIRTASLWIFGFLFDVADVEQELEDALVGDKPKVPARDPKIDRRLDNRYGLVEVAGEPYYTSEVLFALDDAAYRTLAADDAEEDP